jgi:hypothetical protein
MHARATREEALSLLASGLNDCEVARRTGVPRATVRDWRRPRYVRKRPNPPCARCWEPARPVWFSDSDYAELLALYVGDGHIARMGRTYRLRIFLDTSYPHIIEEARLLLDRCFAANEVGLARCPKGSTTILSVYSRHLPCLFPQHGRGKKHERPIILEDWQRVSLETAPMNFIRGCIRSDGSFFINRTGRYRYPSYEFTNYSSGIVDPFVQACDLVGLSYRRNRSRMQPLRTSIRVYRRESVEVLLRTVGIKE